MERDIERFTALLDRRENENVGLGTAVSTSSNARLQRTDLAEASYIWALQRAPQSALARFQLGLLQLRSARPAAAFATWAPLETLGDGHPLLLFKRGFEALALDRFPEARRWLLAGIGANASDE